MVSRPARDSSRSDDVRQSPPLKGISSDYMMDGYSYKSNQPLRRTPFITAVQTVGYCKSRLLRKQMTRPPEKQGETEA